MCSLRRSHDRNAFVLARLLLVRLEIRAHAMLQTVGAARLCLGFAEVEAGFFRISLGPAALGHPAQLRQEPRDGLCAKTLGDEYLTLDAIQRGPVALLRRVQPNDFGAAT